MWSISIVRYRTIEGRKHQAATGIWKKVNGAHFLFWSIITKKSPLIPNILLCPCYILKLHTPVKLVESASLVLTLSLLILACQKYTKCTYTSYKEPMCERKKEIFSLLCQPLRFFLPVAPSLFLLRSFTEADGACTAAGPPDAAGCPEPEFFFS